MTTKFTKTIKGHYEINATGETLGPGHRVAVGEGETRDTGTIRAINGNKAMVRMDSNLSVTEITLSPNVRVIV